MGTLGSSQWYPWDDGLQLGSWEKILGFFKMCRGTSNHQRGTQNVPRNRLSGT